MRRSLLGSPLSFLLAAFLALSNLTSAMRVIESKSLYPCQDNSSVTATLFHVTFTPDNRSIAFDIVGVSTISGNVTADLHVYAYGYALTQQTINPCEENIGNLCPISAAPIDIQSNIDLSESDVDSIPGIAYTIPDLDGKVRIYINSTDTGESLACLEAELTNGKTVYQKGVAWAVAVVAGLALVVSAIVSGLGHSNTAAHVAANALSLFGYFQAQAFVGMSAVELPPIVASWTQNFQWSMGIIRVGFLQDMCTWYQRATGGTPSDFLSDLSTTSVNVQRRSIDTVANLMKRALNTVTVMARSNSGDTSSSSTTTSTVRTIHGVERVGFRASIEITNIFLMGYSFFVIFVMFVIIGLIIFKFILEGLVKSGKMKGAKFHDFRNGWLTVLKGILFRIILIGFPQMVVLCFWELTERDSAGEVVLAIFTIVTMLCVLGWASSKVIRIAQRSITMHKNPAYILYSDPVSLNKWGFLYVQFKATAYYFIIPMLVYILVKGMFIGLGQGSGVTQAIALVLLEAGLLIGVSIMRPYMDKKTNGFNIAIAAVNFTNAIFLLIFSNIFNQPGIVTGVIGVAFFAINLFFSFALICMVLYITGRAIFSKNPDMRYQPMRDDRGSFIKSQTQLTTELDALGAAARGEGKNGHYQPQDRFGDDDSFTGSDPSDHQQQKFEGANLNPQQPYRDQQEPPRSPVGNSVPLLPGQDGRHGPPSYRSNNSSPVPQNAPQPTYSGYGAGYGGQPPVGYGQQTAYDGAPRSNDQSPGGQWQRGAGYDGH